MENSFGCQSAATKTVFAAKIIYMNSRKWLGVRPAPLFYKIEYGIFYPPESLIKLLNLNC
jgi:hypothetical protein